MTETATQDTSVQAPPADDAQPKLSLKSLEKDVARSRKLAEQSARLLLYAVEYLLFNEGRDRHYGPKPHPRINEMRRQADGLKRDLANGVPQDDRPDS